MFNLINFIVICMDFSIPAVTHLTFTYEDNFRHRLFQPLHGLCCQFWMKAAMMDGDALECADLCSLDVAMLCLLLQHTQVARMCLESSLHKGQPKDSLSKAWSQFTVDQVLGFEWKDLDKCIFYSVN